MNACERADHVPVDVPLIPKLVAARWAGTPQVHLLDTRGVVVIALGGTIVVAL